MLSRIGTDGAAGSATAPHFTVFTYDRRGRGDNGDKAPYAVEREVEDIDALIKVAGGSALVCGVSSGAALALEAANRGLIVRKLALYEAPFIVDDNARPGSRGHRAATPAAPRRGSAERRGRLFMKIVGVPAVAEFFGS